MKTEDAIKLFDDFRKKGYTDEIFLKALFRAYLDLRLPLNVFERLVDILGYEFTNDFKRMNESDKLKLKVDYKYANKKATI